MSELHYTKEQVEGFSRWPPHESKRARLIAEDWLTLYAALAALRAERDELVQDVRTMRDEVVDFRNMREQAEAQLAELAGALEKCAYEVAKRGGRFGEDVEAYRCKVCGKVAWSDSPATFPHRDTCVLAPAKKGK